MNEKWLFKDEKIFFKIDIEGSEYEILDQIISCQEKIQGIVIEFHNVVKNLSIIKEFLMKINTNLNLVHIHANNYGILNENGIPQVIEMTLINPKKFEITDERTKRTYPIEGLDFKNHKRGPDIELKFHE